MTSNQQLPIIILVDERDDITHTALWAQCKDMTCPCQLEVEDEIALTFPTEEQLDEQERSVLSQDEPAYDAPHCPQCGHLYAYGNKSHLCDECAERARTCGARSIDWDRIFDEERGPAPRYFGDTLASFNNE